MTTPEIAKMLEDVVGVIDNSNEGPAVTGLARQYLIELAVNSDNSYSTLDELLTDIQSQINRLNSQSDMQEKDDNEGFGTGIGGGNECFRLTCQRAGSRDCGC